MMEDHIEQQKFQAEETDGSDPSQSPLAPAETPELELLSNLVLNAPAGIGNWCDLNDPDDVLEEAEEDSNSCVTPLFSPDVSCVRGDDMISCLIPTRPPYQVLAFNVPDTAREDELYMLFGGQSVIAQHAYRSDLKEVFIRCNNHESMVQIMMKHTFPFKGSTIMLGVLYTDEQVTDLNNHLSVHRSHDSSTVSFENAYYRCARYANIPAPVNYQADMFTRPYQKTMTRPSDDIRMNSNYHPTFVNTKPVNSGPEHSRPASGAEYSRTYSRQQSGASSSSGYRRHSPSIPTSSNAGGKPKASPFGEAKPVDTNQKVLQILKSKEQQGNRPIFIPPEFVQPSTSFRPPQQHFEVDPTKVHIQRRHDVVRPNGLTFVNSSLAQFVPYHQVFPPKPMNILDELIDLSKPPPPLPECYGQPHGNVSTPQEPEKVEAKQQETTEENNKVAPTAFQESFKPKEHHERDSYKRSDGHKRDFNKQNHKFEGSRGDYRRQNSRGESRGFNKGPRGSFGGNRGGHYQQQNHQSLPPPGPNIRRKSSAEPVDETVRDAPVEKSQSAPLCQDTDATQQSSRSSPSAQSLKRPNSANSSMSFVTALSGSEMSTISTELTCVPGSTDSIAQKPCELVEEQRRHSWEGEKSPDKRRESFKKVPADKTKTFRKSSYGSRRDSRNSSASTPQYQSASSVFLDASENLEVILKPISTVDEKAEVAHAVPEVEVKTEAPAVQVIKPVARVKGHAQEKRAPSLPVSRSHVAVVEKEVAKDAKNATETLSAPPTPLGPNKKRKKNKINPTLQNNKYHALIDSDMNTQ